MRRTMSSLRPRGAASASKSVLKPYAYSRLVNSSRVRLSLMALPPRRGVGRVALRQLADQEAVHGGLGTHERAQRDARQRVVHEPVQADQHGPDRTIAVVRAGPAAGG